MICILKKTYYYCMTFLKEIYELDSAKFLLVARLALQAALKKTKVELKLFRVIDMSLMAEKRN